MADLRLHRAYCQANCYLYLKTHYLPHCQKLRYCFRHHDFSEHDGGSESAQASRLRSESGTEVIKQCVSTYKSLNMVAYCCAIDRFQCFQSIFRLCLASSLPHDHCSQDSFSSKPSSCRYCSYKQNQFCGCGLVFGLYSGLRSDSLTEIIMLSFATCTKL